MSVQINGTNGLTFNDGSSQQTAASGFGFKNRIINGDMRIDQRNAGASVNINPDAYTLDRWKAFASGTSKFSVQQNAGSVTPPAGFINYIGLTSLAATTVGSTDYFLIRQNIEGYNIADFAWGTASASAVTLSFWVRSSLTGTFGGALQNSAGNRSYPFTYTINSVNTWEYKTVTVLGDTTGTWLTNNGIGIQLSFSIGTGSTYSGTANLWNAGNYGSATGATSVVGTNGATFYITGVQLEKGSTATSFDYRPYGTELALCQRYLPVVASGNTDIFGSGYNATTTTINRFFVPFKSVARTPPTGISVSSASHFVIQGPVGSGGTPSAITFGAAGVNGGWIDATVATGVAGYSLFITTQNASALLYFTGCEL